MYGFSVVLTAETASFRDQGGQLYHQTLPLPPVSTIIGIAGAAIGITFKQAWEHFVNNDINVGVKDISYGLRGSLPGKGLDLWKYQKIATGTVKSDVLKREFLYQPAYRFFYGCEDSKIIKELCQEFLSPSWALSLGTSDDIALLKEVTKANKIEEIKGGSKELTHCLIPEDQSGNYAFDWDVIQNTPIRTSLELPLVKQLPVGFLFGPGGERQGVKYRPFTFLSGVHLLKNPCPAYQFAHEVVPLFSISKG